MTPKTIDRLKTLGLTSRGFALLVGVHPQTVMGWGKERHGRGLQPEPEWVSLLLDAWEFEPQALALARAGTLAT